MADNAPILCSCGKVAQYMLVDKQRNELRYYCDACHARHVPPAPIRVLEGCRVNDIGNKGRKRKD